MRIRYKKWARPELEASKFYIDNPEEYKGKWKEYFGNDNPVFAEIGCGKGKFIVQNAAENQKLFFSFVSFILTKAGCHYNEIRS